MAPKKKKGGDDGPSPLNADEAVNRENIDLKIQNE